MRLTSLFTTLTANNKTKKTFLSVFILKVETNKGDISEEHNTFVEFEINAFNSPSRTFLYLRATRVSLTIIFALICAGQYSVNHGRVSWEKSEFRALLKDKYVQDYTQLDACHLQ